MEKVKLLRTWFIVFLSAAVVFGGLHAYATYRASQDVDRVLQKVRLKHLAVIPVASSGLRYLRVYLEVENPAYNPVTVSL